MEGIIIEDTQLRIAAQNGHEAFLQCILQEIKRSVGGSLDGDALAKLSTDQLTLWAYDVLREELLEGGFVQLIHNGWADFFFKNPFALVMKQWGVRDLSKLMYEAAKLYKVYGEEIMKDCTDEEFMALYERYPQFEEFDDDFVEKEEEFTSNIAQYVDENISHFCTIS